MTLKALVSESGLSQEDKEFWLGILVKLDDAQTKLFEDFVDDKEENLKELTGNIKDKRVALESLDQAALDKIIETEINA